jgi:hypothetical protein
MQAHNIEFLLSPVAEFYCLSGRKYLLRTGNTDPAIDFIDAYCTTHFLVQISTVDLKRGPK